MKNLAAHSDQQFPGASPPRVAMELEKLLMNGKITASCEITVTRTLHQTLQATKMNFEILIGKHFFKTHNSIRLNLIFMFIHYFAINQKYNNSIQKCIKDNIQYSNKIIYKIKCGKGKEAYIEAEGLKTIGFVEL